MTPERHTHPSALPGARTRDDGHSPTETTPVRRAVRPATITAKAWRRLYAAALVPAVLVAATACGATGGGGAKDASGVPTKDVVSGARVDAAAAKLVPAEIRSRGSVTMAADLHYPPTSFLDSDNKTPIGYNVDIARLLAETLGLKLVIRNVSFDSVIPGIEAGRYDFTATNMSPTPERLQVLDMVTYWSDGSSLVYAKGNPLKLSMGDESSLCGHKVAVVTGSTQAETYLPQISGDCRSAGKSAVDQVVLPNVQAALTQLASKRIEAVFSDTPQLAWAVKQQPQAFELSAEQYKKKVGDNIVALGVKKGSGLAPALQAAMQALMDDGAYKATLEKWGLGAGVIPTAQLLK